jgi:NADPH:quinone reductase-like Zn-dependent oxidoreductase
MKVGLFVPFHKLADFNFMGRTPPVVLGLDLAGVVVAVGMRDCSR